MERHVRKAFTLVEILIVVIILGILAAIVVPQFTSASDEAQRGNVQSQLQTIRNQIELYRVRNNVYPFYDPASGALDITWDRLLIPPGNEPPYLKNPPVNPRPAIGDRAARESIVAGEPGGRTATDANGWYWSDLEKEISAGRFDEYGSITTVPELNGVANWLDG